MASVTLRSVTKSFGDITAVDDMTLEIKDGEFFILLGPTGAGKTTTLRLIAGLEQQTKGDIFIDNKNVNDWAPANRDVAFIFQYYSLYPTYTVRQNLEFPLKSAIRNLCQEEINKKVAEVAKILNIEHLLDRKTNKLSGGEMQRVSIGRAIVRTPKVFLMDEPLSNLDAKLREKMRGELKYLQGGLGSTIFFVTHDQIEAMTMSDRIAVMNKGKLLQTGTPDDIYFNPQNLFVATFVGNPIINVFKAAVDFDKLIIEPQIFEYIPTNTQQNLLNAYKNKQVFLCIRPEDIEITRDAKKSDDYLEADIYIVEQMGMEDIVQLKIGNTFLKSIALPSFNSKRGESVFIKLNKEKIYFFDNFTEERIK
ncbi:MAG: ABC transporter ATP-binding protein [Actinomycetota bacterium]|nr:ABC transporter ATP-binding protein [Actinomycetota bacterium]